MASIHKSRLNKSPIDIDSNDSDDADVDPSNDDDGGRDCTKVVDFLFGIHRKMVKKQKSRANTEPSFTRFSARYFSEVISSLSEYQKSIFHKYEFDYLLLFESNCVSIKFATWIAKNVDVRTFEIILKDKIIPVTVESVHAVLGLPLGGIEFSKDYEAGKQCVLSMLGQVSIPSVKFFGNQLIQKKELSENQIITSFLIVLFLDYVDFGSRHVDQGYPHIFVWKDDMISVFSELDKIDDNNFGLRPLKDFSGNMQLMYVYPEPTHSRSISIRAKIDSAIGSMIPDFFKDKISQMLSTYLCSHHLVDSESCEDVLVSILALLLQSSQFDPLKHQNETHIYPSQINTEAGPSNCQPTTATVRQSEFDDLNDDGLQCATRNISVSNAGLYDKSLSNSIGKDCPSLGRIAGSFVAALSLVKYVANKFRSRLTQFNSRRAIFGEDVPPFRLLDSEDYSSDSDQCHELAGNVTPSCFQQFISFHSVPDTPNDMIHGNQDVGSNERRDCQNANKRIFQDLTFLGESKFNDHYKKLCTKTDELYNSSNKLSTSTQELSSSGGKVALHGPRIIVIPARHATDPFITDTRRFPITAEENRYFIAICRIAESSKWHSFDVVDIDNVKAKVYNFGHSLKKGGYISTCVMSVFCWIMFHNNHPSRSKKNYFFPSIGIGEQLIAHVSNCDMEKVKKSFLGTATARKLHLCDMLYFPIYFNQHWFLFTVDIKDKMVVFLDSLHNEGDEYFQPIMSLLIDNFQSAWDRFVHNPMDFLSFKIVFPPVPRQVLRPKVTRVDCIIQHVLSNDNINNIRVQYENQIFFHTKNKMLQTEIEDAVLNWTNFLIGEDVKQWYGDQQGEGREDKEKLLILAECRVSEHWNEGYASQFRKFRLGMFHDDLAKYKIKLS
uniref:Ubiquitin-like protease family profile domain-containing protein n=1 Tax=Oryza punctata TaxID=4537 RepID=A0A0E0JHU1_ORYPU